MKYRKIYEVWYYPLWVFILVFLFITLIGSEYYFHFGDFNEGINLFLIGSITLLATFAGVLSPLLVQRAYQNQGERRQMLFAISAVWSELRALRDQVDLFEKNYLFKATLNDMQLSLEQVIALVAIKIDTMSSIVELMPHSAYDSMIDSGTISLLKTDELYNSICQTYENLEHFKSLYAVVSSGLLLRNKMLAISGTPLSGTPFEATVREDMEAKLKMLYAELKFVQPKIKSTIAEIGKTLDGYDIKQEEIPKKILEGVELPGPATIEVAIQSMGASNPSAPKLNHK